MLSWKDKILLTERIGTTKNYFFLKFMHSYFLKIGVFGQALVSKAVTGLARWATTTDHTGTAKLLANME